MCDNGLTQFFENPIRNVNVSNLATDEDIVGNVVGKHFGTSNYRQITRTYQVAFNSAFNVSQYGSREKYQNSGSYT